MSGTPDWKPGLSARPSSLAGVLALTSTTSVALRSSPSSIDLSGRHEHAPIASQVPKRAICDVADEDKPCNRRVRIRGTPSSGGIFGGDAVTSANTHTILSDQGATRSMMPPVMPMVPQPRSHTGNTVDRGWKTGAYFRHIIRPGLAHRVYEGPPDGTSRVRLGPEEVMVDFARPYKIYALFVNDVYLAVQIKIPEQLYMSGYLKPSMMVWSNVRRGDEWWARLIDPDVARDLQNSQGCEDDEGQQSQSLKIKRLPWKPRIAIVD